MGLVGFDGHLNTGLTLRTVRIKGGVAEVDVVLRGLTSSRNLEPFLMGSAAFSIVKVFPFCLCCFFSGARVSSETQLELLQVRGIQLLCMNTLVFLLHVAYFPHHCMIPGGIRVQRWMHRTPKIFLPGRVGVFELIQALQPRVTVKVRAGATLLFDSEPHLEEAETELKASAMIDAVTRSDPQPGATGSEVILFHFYLSKGVGLRIRIRLKVGNKLGMKY